MTTAIGMLNIMPEAHRYEPFLLDSFCGPERHTEPVWIRLGSHGYGSTPPAELARYRTWEELEPDHLDGVVLTGAPVEHLPFQDVRYWPELTAILDEAERRHIPVFGICWGGMVTADRLGIEPEVYEHKLFGVFDAHSPGPAHDVSGNGDGRFHCPHSRFAGLNPRSVAEAVDDGRARLLGTGTDCGPFIVESKDRFWTGHLGHMEYPPERLLFEWKRDQKAGRTDVPAPAGIDPDRPVLLWQTHRRAIVDRWLETISIYSRSEGTVEVNECRS